MVPALHILFTVILLFTKPYDLYASPHKMPIAFIGRSHCDDLQTNHGAHRMSANVDVTIIRGGDTTPINNTATNTTDIDELSKRLKIQEIQKVRKAQQFLKKQQRRREMDKTWLDKCITGTIEFVENVCRWEIIDVKRK
jgi:hypothetical protein